MFLWNYAELDTWPVFCGRFVQSHSRNYTACGFYSNHIFSFITLFG